MPSLLTFGVKGGFEAGKDFYDALKLIKRLVNIGDAKSLACHPASTTHRQMPAAEQRKAGVTPETIRLSVGIEHNDDIIADLDQALAAAAKQQLKLQGGVMSPGAEASRNSLLRPARRTAGHIACRAGQQHARRGDARHRTAIRPPAQGCAGTLDVRLQLFSLRRNPARRNRRARAWKAFMPMPPACRPRASTP